MFVIFTVCPCYALWLSHTTVKIERHPLFRWENFHQSAGDSFAASSCSYQLGLTCLTSLTSGWPFVCKVIEWEVTRLYDSQSWVRLTVIDCGLIYRHTSSVMHLFATVAVFWLYSCLKERLPSTCTAVQPRCTVKLLSRSNYVITCEGISVSAVWSSDWTVNKRN